MKQIFFAVILIAMASFTGCLGFGEEEPDDLITPIEGYETPQTSTIRVDSGIKGKIVNCENNGNGSSDNCDDYYLPCMSHGWYDIDKDDNYEYCDIDGHTNNGPQVIVKKVGNTVTIECIKDFEELYCKGNDYAYVLFTSIEGLQEMISCDLRDTYYDGENSQPIFHKCGATLGFEPVSFEITYSSQYFEYTNSDYYYHVSFRVF